MYYRQSLGGWGGGSVNEHNAYTFSDNTEIGFPLIIELICSHWVRNAYKFQHDAIRTCSKRYVLRTTWLNRVILLNRNFPYVVRHTHRKTRFVPITRHLQDRYCIAHMAIRWPTTRASLATYLHNQTPHMCLNILLLLTVHYHPKVFLNTTPTYLGPRTINFSSFPVLETAVSMDVFKQQCSPVQNPLIHSHGSHTSSLLWADYADKCAFLISPWDGTIERETREVLCS